MKKLIVAAYLLAFSSPAFAADDIEVIAKDDQGRATKVMIEGKEYAICTPQVQDACLNPREAGLDFGNRALDHWPGKPASAD